MSVKIENKGNTYKNRHAKIHKNRAGRPRIIYPTTMANSKGYISPDDITKDFIPIRKIDEETGEVTDL